MKTDKFNLHKLWTFAIVIYIVCNAAFSYGDLKILNTIALYFFLGISAFCILIKGKIKLSGMVLSLILYALLMLVGMLYTPTNPNAVNSVVYDFITMMILLICAVQYIDTKEDVEHIITAFMWAGVALAIYVYAQYGNEFWSFMREAADNKYGSVDRLDGELANANIIGMYAAISTMIAVYKLIYQKNSVWKKIVYIAIVVFCFIIDMATASKKGLLVLLIVSVAMWFYGSLGSKNFLKQLRNLLILCAAILAVLWMISNLKIFSAISVRMEGFFGILDGGKADNSSTIRANMIETGLEVWLENPLIGAGTAASNYYFGVYAHNNFVELLMNSGVIGFVIFYAPQIVATVKYLYNHKRYKANGKIAILLFALFMAIGANGVGLVYYYDRYFMMLVVTIVSASFAIQKQPGEITDKSGEKQNESY